ncbi:hypothetical protein FQZ97_974960 [compost metagenome]
MSGRGVGLAFCIRLGSDLGLQRRLAAFLRQFRERNTRFAQSQLTIDKRHLLKGRAAEGRTRLTGHGQEFFLQCFTGLLHSGAYRRYGERAALQRRGGQR